MKNNTSVWQRLGREFALDVECGPGRAAFRPGDAIDHWISFTHGSAIGLFDMDTSDANAATIYDILLSCARRSDIRREFARGYREWLSDHRTQHKLERRRVA